MADNEEQQTCEGNNHHIREINQQSAIQIQNNRHTRRQFKADSGHKFES